MGFFIVFEGGEGVGKGVQKRLLKQALEERGYTVFMSREVGGPEISEEIRNIVQHPKNKGKIAPITEMFLIIAARAQHTIEWIIPKLKEYDFYISDRYRLSSVIYQGYGRGLMPETKICNEIATHGLHPDLTLVLDIEAEKGLQRTTTTEFGQKDRFEQEPLTFHEKVNEGYRKEAEMAPNRIKLIPYIENQPEEIHKIILSHVLKIIQKE